MDKIFGYISYMLPFMMIALFTYVIIRLIIIRWRNKRINIKREVPFLLFIPYVSGLLSITAFPKIIINDGIRVIVGPGSVNLVPFRTILSYFNESPIIFAILFVGNIVMFMPIGFFIPLIWKKRALISTLVGFSFSLFIEISQLFVVRNTDIDDLVLNTLGVYIGYLLYMFVQNVINRIKNSRNYSASEAT